MTGWLRDHGDFTVDEIFASQILLFNVVFLMD